MDPRTDMRPVAYKFKIMHITNNSQYLGHIDGNITISPTSNKVSGWVVNKLGNSITSDAIKILDSDTPIICEVEIKPRADVHAAYFKNSQYTRISNSEETKYYYSGFEIIYPSNLKSFIIVVNNVPVFNIKNNNILENLDDIIRRNKNTKPELIVVDNFYENPDKVREYAMGQEFKTNELYHKGNRTEKNYIPSWAKAEFSRLLNMEVTAFVGATGVFQYCVAKDNIVYHYDTQEYAAMVYLSPNAPLQTGTQTFRSKITGLYGAATDADVLKFGKTKDEINAMSFNGNNFYDRHNMELVDSVANIYNRCVIFNARSLHAATSYYGSSKENSRLFHLYFFNCK